MSTDKTIAELIADSDDIVGKEGGFLAIRRLLMRNRYSDGAVSEPYLCDFVVRPYGLDAVCVAMYHRGAEGAVDVLVRAGLRPALALGRQDTAPIPIPDDKQYLLNNELVAGIIENDDKGEAGIRHRAAEEVFEEAGYRVSADDVVLLGAPSFPSAGIIAEKLWFAAVEITDPSDHELPDGDGSPMEHGAEIRWLELDAAIAACVAGDIEDAKTEVGLRRLRDHLRAY